MKQMQNVPGYTASIDLIYNAFPSQLKEDVRAVVAFLGPAEVRIPGYSCAVANAPVTIPPRIIVSYSSPQKLSLIQQTIHACLHSRNANGFVRKTAIERLLALPREPWSEPYLFAALADYVLDVACAVVDKVDPNSLRRFAKDNPGFHDLVKTRVISYWNEYYRSFYIKEEYPPYEFFNRLEGRDKHPKPAQVAFEKQILRKVITLRLLGLCIDVLHRNNAKVYIISSGQCIVQLTVAPDTWLGLVFKLKHTRLFYQIDTDLYDIVAKGNQRFVQAVKNDILIFLQSLADGRLCAGRVRSGAAVIFPQADGSMVLLKQGRFFISKSHLSSKRQDKLLRQGVFRPAIISSSQSNSIRDAITRLEELNKIMDYAKYNAGSLENYTQEYFTLLRLCLPVAMESAIAPDKYGAISTLKRIFYQQRNLMAIRHLTDVPMGSDLWEIACDFDNDDPRIYDYLVNKIRNRHYAIQSRRALIAGDRHL